MRSLAQITALRKVLPVALFLGVLSFVAVPTARAQLTLNYDTSQNKLWFTGSDTITADGAGNIVWWNGVSGTDPFYHLFAGNPIVPNLLFSTDPSPASTVISMDLDGSNRFSFTVDSTNNSAVVTLVGLGYGSAIGFGDFTGLELAVLNSLSGTQVPLFSGTGGSPLNLVAVPEPSTYAALLGALALAVSIHRRKSRAKPAFPTT